MPENNDRLKQWQEKIESSKYKGNKVREINDYRASGNEKVVIINNYASDPKPKSAVGFWRRVFATIIDGIVLAIFFAILRTQSTGLLLFFTSLYYILLPITNLQGTIGKAAIGAKITDLHGNRVRLDRSVGRYLAYIPSCILCIGFIMVAFHGRKRGLHDLIAGTEVVNRHG